MKVLWFNHRDLRHPKAGGAERTIHEVSKRLVKLGYDVTISSVNPGDLKRSERIDGVNIIRAGGNIRAHLRVPIVIRKLKPDIVIDDLAHVVPWTSTWFTKKPVIAFFRHLHKRSLPGQVSPLEARIFGFSEVIYKYVYKNCKFVTETESGISDLVDLGIKKDNIVKILPGVDRSKFKPFKKTVNPSLLYFGGLKDYKRPLLSLDVIKRVNREDLKLDIVGNGPSLPKLRKLFNEEGLSEKVRFLGRVPDADLPKIIGQAWLNLHFSVTEGFGLTIIESASCGTPTIALDAPGVSEVINNFGLGATEKDIEKFGNRVVFMLNDYKSWPDKVYNNSNLFSWERTVDDWDRLLKSPSVKIT